MGTPVENVAETHAGDGLSEAAVQIQAAADAKKCWACGCLRHALDAMDVAVPESSRPATLAEAIASARARLVPQRYECLGCEVCYPAVALNALSGAGGCAADAAVCPTKPVETRVGWPPLPGSYRVLRYHAPVAVCTLNSEELIGPVSSAEPEAIAIAGTLQTPGLRTQKYEIKNKKPTTRIRGRGDQNSGIFKRGPRGCHARISAKFRKLF
jgi:tetrahydromethanopterin S-methyltransferase subunit A